MGLAGALHAHQDTDSDEDDHTRDRIIDHHNIIEKYFYHHQDDKVESERPKWKDITSDAISECHECEDPPVHRHSESRQENIENMHARNRKYIQDKDREENFFCDFSLSNEDIYPEKCK